MIRALTATAGALAVFASPAAAQSMQGMQMPGMDMSKPIPAKKEPASKPKAPAKKAAVRKAPVKPKKPQHAPTGQQSGAAKTGAANAMPGMDMSGGDSGGQMQSMPGMDMSGGHDTASMPGMALPQAPSGTDLPAGNAAAPPPPADHYADRSFPVAAMQPARAMFRHEQGGETFAQVMFNLAEVQIRNGRDGYRWDGEGWFGGDYNRFVVKSEGEGTFRKGVDAAEVQALYSRAIGPYFNLQGGVRHDFQPSPTQTYATVGIEGLAPYEFETEAALFVSTKGDVLARAEGWYDERLTQRLILQPRVELNFAAQDVPRDRIGAGLTDAELGLRLRYEISRKIAPYIGISYEAKTGRTADFARADGESPHMTSLVLGIRTWF